MKRSFCEIGGGFVAGAFLSSLVSVQTQAIFIIACVFVFLFVCLYHKKRSKISICVFSLAFLLGTACYLLKTTTQYQPAIDYAGKSVTVTAEVQEITRRPNGKYTYRMKAQEVLPLDTQLPEQIQFQFLLYSEDLSVQPYQTIRFPAEFYLPSSSDSFDSIRYYQGKGIYLLAYLAYLAGQNQTDEPICIEVLSRRDPPALELFQQLNQKIAEQAEQKLSPDAAAIFQGMLLGDRSDIDYALRQQYTNSGIVHLLAISGLHIAVISGLLGFLLRRFPPWLRFSLQAAVLISFILFSGIQVSAVRSGIMILLLSVGQLFRRKSDGINLLFFAGLLIVGTDVFAVMDLSFCMSFLATLGVLLFMEQSPKWMIQISSSALQKILQLLGITVSANIFLLPVYLYQFKTMSVIAPVSNLLISLLTAPVLCWGFLLCVLSFLPLPLIFWQIEDWLISLQNLIANCFGRLPFATIGLDYPEFRYWFFAAICLLLAGYLWRKEKMFPLTVVLSAALFLCCNCTVIFKSQNAVQIDFVGDNSAANAVIYNHGHATVIAMADNDYIDRLTLQYLRGKGVFQVDNLIIAYSGFSAYQDTVDFCQSIEVQNIFYHKDNTALEMILKEYRQLDSIQLIAIEEGLKRILIDEKLQITPAYGRKALNLSLNCFGNQFYLGTESGGESAQGCSVYALTGQEKQFQQTFTAGMVLLLQRQYTAEDIPQNYYETRNKIISFRISRENGLKVWLPE